MTEFYDDDDDGDDNEEEEEEDATLLTSPSSHLFCTEAHTIDGRPVTNKRHTLLHASTLADGMGDLDLDDTTEPRWKCLPMRVK